MTAYLLAIALLLCGALWAYRSERSAWNGGICKDNGLPWVRFDTDSQGGRGYRAGDQVTWVSWPGIDSLRCERSEG
jgi:hypothetical protein